MTLRTTSMAATIVFAVLSLAHTDEDGKPDALLVAQRDKLWELAQKLAAESKLEDAIATAEKVLLIEQEAFGEVHEELAGTLQTLAIWSLQSLKSKEAHRYAAELYEMSRKQHGANSWQARHNKWQADYYRRVADADDETVQQLVTIEAQYIVRRGEEDFATAAQEIKRLIPLEQELLGETHPFYANTHRNIAECLIEIENYEQAIGHAEKALQIRSRVYGDRDSDTAEAAWFVGQCQFNLEMYTDARDSFVFCRDIWQQLNDRESTAYVELHIGFVNTWLDEWRLASKAFHRSMILYRKLGDVESETELFRHIMSIEEYVTWADRTWVGLYVSQAIQKIGQVSPGLALAVDSWGRPKLSPLLSSADEVQLNGLRSEFLELIGHVEFAISVLRQQKKALETDCLCHELKYGITIRQLAELLSKFDSKNAPSSEEQSLWKSSAAWAAAKGEPFTAADICGTLSNREWEHGQIENAVAAVELGSAFLSDIEPGDSISLRHRKAQHLLMTADRLVNYVRLDDALSPATAAWQTLLESESVYLAGMRVSVARTLYDIHKQRGSNSESAEWFRVAEESLRQSESLLQSVVIDDNVVPDNLEAAQAMISAAQALSHFVDIESKLSIDHKYAAARRLDQLLDQVKSKLEDNPNYVPWIPPLTLARQSIWYALMVATEAEVQNKGTQPEWYQSAADRLNELKAAADSVDTLTTQADDALGLVRVVNELVVEHRKTGVVNVDKARRLSEISANLLADPIVGNEPSLRPILMIGRAFGPMVDGHAEEALKYCDEACICVANYLNRAGGNPRDIIEVSRSLRANLDPFSFGQNIALANDDVPRAFSYAIRGRGFGARAAFKAAGRDMDEPTLASLRSTLSRDERLVVIATQSTMGHDTDVGTYVVYPKTSSAGVKFYRSGDSLTYPEDTGGVVLVDIEENSVAAVIGLRPLDLIQSYGDQKVTSENFQDAIARHSGAANVPLSVWRDGRQLSLTVNKVKRLGVLFEDGAPASVRDNIGLTRPVDVTTFQNNLLKTVSKGNAGLRGATISSDDSTGVPRVWSRGRSYQLFRSLFSDTLWKELCDCRRIYVSLPAELSGLPLETLVVEAPDLRQTRLTRWLDVGPPIVYLPAGRLSIDSDFSDESESSPRLEFVGLGGADFSSFSDMPQLPGTIREVDASAIHIGEKQSRKLLTNNATEANLKTAVDSSRFVLVGTHGVPQFGENVLDSALLMTPTDNSDGRLTLFELLSEWSDVMKHTQTTILSACQSNRGLILHDENSLGLPFGFLVAGSESVIASQWSVDDKATAILFAEFFRQIRNGKNSLNALNAARKTLRADDRYSEPYYWAPFIYVSETATQ